MLALVPAVIDGAVVSVVATQICDVSIYVAGVFGAPKPAYTIKRIAIVTCALLLVVAVFVRLAFRSAATHDSQRPER